MLGPDKLPRVQVKHVGAQQRWGALLGFRALLSARSTPRSEPAFTSAWLSLPSAPTISCLKTMASRAARFFVASGGPPAP